MLALYIALGGNLGDRSFNLAEARRKISLHYPVVQVSPIYETPALMPVGAPKEWDMPFLNQVILAQASAAPQDVLACLKTIEREMGRTSASRWEPRIIDIDMVAYGDLYLRSDALNLPHSAMHERDFVLKPLCDITPDWIYPAGPDHAGKTAHELLDALPEIQVSRYDAH